MNINKPLRIVLFSYELLRLLFLAAMLSLFPTAQSALSGGIFPYLAYFSANALFPLIALFLVLKPLENRNYLPLFMAGKTIAVVLYFYWIVFSFQFESESLRGVPPVMIMVYLTGIFIICLVDILSIFGIWIINKKPAGPGIVVVKEDPEPGANGGQ